MKIDNPALVAKWANTTIRNVHLTYRTKKPEVYSMMCYGSILKEKNITPSEMEILVKILDEIRRNK